MLNIKLFLLSSFFRYSRKLTKKGINKMIKEQKIFIKEFKKLVRFYLRGKNFPFYSHCGYSPKQIFEIYLFDEKKTEFSKRFYKYIKHPHFKRKCETFENHNNLIFCFAIASEKIIEWEINFPEIKYIVEWISEKIIWDIPWQYINSNKIYIYANKINRNNRFSEKSFSEDFYNIIIEKITFIKEKDYPIVFSMIKEKLKKQIKNYLKK